MQLRGSKQAAVAGGAVIAALALPWAYVALGVGLTIRAAALPALQARWARTDHPLRPVHVGLVELVAGIALVVVAFATL